MTIIRADQLVKIYDSQSGKIHALDGLDIEIPEGATALLGPNGSGKSTLIKIILGLLKPTSGSVRLFEDRANTAKQARNLIGYMPETPSIITKVNAVKYVRHFGILSGLSFTRAMQRTHEVLDYVGLGDRYREIDGYSTGMKQRLLFAQALVHDPELIILDEPTTGLSPEGREEMLELIREIHEEYDKSIMFSTHILQDVEAITNYTVLLNKGKTLFQGTSEEVAGLYPDVVIVEPDVEIERTAGILAEQYQTNIIGNQVHITVNDGMQAPTMTQVASLLQPAGIGVLSVQRRSPNLEDLFLNRIEKDINQ